MQKKIEDDETEFKALAKKFDAIANQKETESGLDEDRPFCVKHHRHYVEGKVVDTVPMLLTLWASGVLRRLDYRYVLMNLIYQEALRRGRVDYRFVTLLGPLLSRADKTTVYNRMRSKKVALIPVKVTIVEVIKHARTKKRIAPASVVTRELGKIPIDDSNNIPNDLKQALVFRYQSKTGGRWFRLGWTLQDEAKGFPAEAGSEADSEDSANFEDL